MIMIKDKTIKTLVKEMRDECNNYLSYVNSANECAFSDRKLEYIIDVAKRLDEVHNKRFKSSKKLSKKSDLIK